MTTTSTSNSDYELTESQLNELTALGHALSAILGCLERLANEILRTYQTNRARGLLEVMHAVNDTKMKLGEVKRTVEDWEPTVFDEFLGRKVKPKPTRNLPKYSARHCPSGIFANSTTMRDFCEFDYDAGLPPPKSVPTMPAVKPPKTHDKRIRYPFVEQGCDSGRIPPRSTRKPVTPDPLGCTRDAQPMTMSQFKEIWTAAYQELRDLTNEATPNTQVLFAETQKDLEVQLWAPGRDSRSLELDDMIGVGKPVVHLFSLREREYVVVCETATSRQLREVLVRFFGLNEMD